MRFALLAVTVACLLANTPASAQWKWKDASGRVQYSDLPPPAGVGDSQILQRPAGPQQRSAAAAAASVAASSAGLSPGRTVEPELEAKRRQAEQEKAAKQKADEQRVAAAKADNCSRARSQLRAIDEGMRLSRVNEKGEREFLDDKARADEAARTRAIIGSDCP